MKKIVIFLIAVMMLGACEPLTRVSHDNNTSDGAGPILTTYNGINGSAEYSLVVTHIPARNVFMGDEYELTIENTEQSASPKKTSSGTIETVEERKLTLKPRAENAVSFTMGFSGGLITDLTGVITFDDGTSQSGPGHIHSWGAWTVTKAATCTATGIEARVCSADTSHLETRTVAALGHNWGAWTQTKAPTATQAGEETRTCTRDPSHKETRTVAPTGTSTPAHVHSWGAWTVTKAAACTTSGEETRVCSADSSHKETRTVAALGHNWGAWTVTKAPTATQAGEETRTCTRDPSHKETRTVAATGPGHNGTPGLAFELINGNAYRVSKGTVTGGAVVIPAAYSGLPVTEIGESAFDSENITSITIPSSVKTIGAWAFVACTSLTNVTLSSGLTSIGIAAFYACTSLTSITIPGSVTSIGGSAFSGCRSLTSITIPPDVKIINSFTFSGCTSLTSVTLPSGLTSIGSYAFGYCTSIASITIPSSVKELGGSAFEGWTASQTINVMGHANQASADAMWGGAWRNHHAAVINYRG